LRRIQAVAWARCFPGHGAPFDDVAGALATNVAQIEQRSAKLRDELEAGGPATVYGLAQRMYRRALERRFWQIVSTVQGHLDLLLERGEAAFDGATYRASSGPGEGGTLP
jgi:hypothetical protein